jgi:hypothetical protein
MHADIRGYQAEAILRDGRSIYIRALRSDDQTHLLALFSRLSPRSVYFRFFRFKKWLSESELALFTDLDFVREAALIAAFQEGESEHIVGVGRYSALQEENGAARAEVAFAVADAFQGKVWARCSSNTWPASHADRASPSSGLSCWRKTAA